MKYSREIYQRMNQFVKKRGKEKQLYYLHFIYVSLVQVLGLPSSMSLFQLSFSISIL